MPYTHAGPEHGRKKAQKTARLTKATHLIDCSETPASRSETGSAGNVQSNVNPTSSSDSSPVRKHEMRSTEKPSIGNGFVSHGHEAVNQTR